jgi:hypothetical protein
MGTEQPRGWSSDRLSQFVDLCHQNTFAPFARLGLEYNHLKKMNELFNYLVDRLNNSRDWFPAFFVLCAHSAYLGGARMAVSGQVVDAHMVLRGCLEAGLYGLYLSRNHESTNVWARRHDDEASRRSCRNEFSTGRLMQCLERESPRVYTVANILYERTIDSGAHPNERAVLENMRRTETDDAIRSSFSTLLPMCRRYVRLCEPRPRSDCAFSTSFD